MDHQLIDLPKHLKTILIVPYRSLIHIFHKKKQIINLTTLMDVDILRIKKKKFQKKNF